VRTRILLGITVLAAIVGVLLLFWGKHPPSAVDASRRANAASASGSTRDAGLLGAAPAVPLQADLTIRGQVMGPKGPVPGATVVATTSAGEDVLSERRCQCGNECGQKLLECGCGEAAGQLMDLVAERRGEVQPVARATTDTEGRFLLTGLSEGTYAVWAEAPRTGAAVAQGTRAGDADVIIKLGAGVAIAGTVKREDGRGVAGAVVTAIYAKHSRFFEVAAGADGAFSLGPLPEGDYTVVASAPGLLPSRERVTNGSSRRVKLELVSPRSLAGSVTLEGAPAGGAAVSLHGEHKRQEIGTEPDGTFAFDSLRPGQYELRAAAGDRVAQETITVAKGNVRGVALALRAGVHIEGKVVDDAGAAIAAVHITADEIAPSRRSHVAAARSSSDGRFRLGPLEPGEFELSTELEGFVRADPAKVVAVASASTKLVLKRAQPIRGMVVDPEGKPVREVRVAAVTKRTPAGSDDQKGSARTGENGAFTLDVPGGEYDIVVRSEGFREARVPVRAPAADVVVQLDRGTTIEGEVIDEDGAPVAEAQISIAPQSGDQRTRTSLGGGSADRGGHFVVSGLAAGPVLVIAGRPGDGGESWSSSYAHTPLDLPESGTVRVKLRFDAALAISGSVVGPDGVGVPDAKVHAWATHEARSKDKATALAERSSGTAVTDGAGRFTVRRLKAGEHVLIVMKEGFDAPRDGAHAQAGDSNVRIVLTKTAFLRGRVVGDGGVPVLRFQVNGKTNETSDGRFALPVTKLSGFYQGSGGPFPVRFSADGFASAEQSVTVERGVDVDLGDIALSQGRTISGVVVDAATGGPIPAARVRSIFVEEAKQYLSATLSDSRPEALVVTGADGTFVVPHVGEGALLRVAREGYAPATVAVGPDQGPLRIALGRGGAIAIRIQAANGEPMAGLDLAILGRAEGSDASSTGERFGANSGKTDESGRYEASGLLAGTYFIYLNSPDRNPGLVAQPVVLHDGQRVEVELKARQAGTTLQLSISGPGAKTTGELHVGLLRGVVPQIMGAQDLLKIGTPIRPRDDETPDAPVFELLAPGPYTVLVAKMERDGFRVFTHPIEVGPGPRQHADVVVPADLPVISR
jgi:protocatechuate 3,4-dioxygenase beta subunit